MSRRQRSTLLLAHARASAMPRRWRGAFTLIETVAALIVLALAVPPMLFAIRRATADRVDPLRFSRAQWLATEKLEEVIADRHSATRGYGHLIDAKYPDEMPIALDPDYERSVSIVERAADLQSAGTEYKIVTVSVAWTDAAGTRRTLDVATVLTEY